MPVKGAHGAFLAAAGFLVAALDVPLALLGAHPQYRLASGDRLLTFHPEHLFELAGFLLILPGAVLLLLQVRRAGGRVPRMAHAGAFLLAAGAGLRVLFYLLTVLLADWLMGDPDPALAQETVQAWFRAWHSAAIAAAAGAALLAASLASPGMRTLLGGACGVAAAVFALLTVTQTDVTGLRALSLAVLAAGLLEVGIELRRNPFNRYG